MKILSITAQKPHSTGSGVYLTELVKNWAGLGHQQAVVAGVYPEDTVSFPEDLAFYPVFYRTEALPFAIAGMSDEMPYESTRYRDMTPEMTAQFTTAFEAAVRRAVAELEPDVIVCHHLYLLTALVRAWFPERKILGVCHGSDLRQMQKNPLERDFIRQRIGTLSGIVALQEAQRQQILELFACPPEAVRVIGGGYNQQIFYRGERIKKPYAQMVFAGKVSEKKGVFSLLRALDHLTLPAESLRVKIAGGSGAAAEYEAIRALAAECRYPVEFLGSLPQPELAEVFRESDLFVLPSFYEGLALVLLEAMACGCAVVCSDLPGVRPWMDASVPGHRIRFVPLPAMENTDEPRPEELPAFETALASAIEAKLTAGEPENPDLSGVSWEGVAKRILDMA